MTTKTELLKEADDLLAAGTISAAEREKMRSHILFGEVLPSEVGSEVKLATYLANKEEREKYPWRASQERFEEARARAAECYDQRDKLVALAKAKAEAGLLTPFESIVLNYTLFQPDDVDGKYVLSFLLLNIPDQEKLAFHNWSIVRNNPKSWVASHGKAIASLDVPLFPAAMEVLNEKILSAAAARLLSGAGGAATAQHAGVFRVSSWPPTLHQAQTTGPISNHTTEVLLGGAYAVGVDASGRVDLSEVQEAFFALSARLSALESRAPKQQPKNNNNNNHNSHPVPSNSNFNSSKKPWNTRLQGRGDPQEPSTAPPTYQQSNLSNNNN